MKIINLDTTDISDIDWEQIIHRATLGESFVVKKDTYDIVHISYQKPIYTYPIAQDIPLKTHKKRRGGGGVLSWCLKMLFFFGGLGFIGFVFWLLFL